MHPKEKILWWSSNLWSFSQGMLGPLFTVFAQKIGGSIFDIAWAWGIYLIVTGVVVILVGKFSDHHSKEYLMIVGYVLTAVLTFLYLLVKTPAQLFLVQAGLGLGLAMATPTWFALFEKYSTRKTDGAMWGLADGGDKISMGIAIILGGFLVKWFSFSALFIVMGSIQVLATVYQARMLFKK